MLHGFIYIYVLFKNFLCNTKIKYPFLKNEVIEHNHNF